MIIFEKIRWKNLLSYGNVWTEVNLKRSPNTLIVGENGSGKSTILDALCYVLFSRPFRRVTKKQLVNSVNTKGTSIGTANRKSRFDVKPSLGGFVQAPTPKGALESIANACGGIEHLAS